MLQRFDYISTQVLQLRPNCLIHYQKITNHGSRLMQSTAFQQNIDALKEQVKYTGTMTVGAEKRLTKAINIMVQSSPTTLIYNPVSKKRQNFKLSFITLTIPELTDITLHDCNKKMLEPFLRWMRQVHNTTLYIWKAERQKRGAIHYHITSNKFIHYQEIRNKWNWLLSKHNLNESYVKEHQHNNANSTDVHSVKNIKNLAPYLIKYFTKTEQNPDNEKGKIWDCSMILKKAKYYEITATEDIMYNLSIAESQQKVTIIQKDRCNFIRLNKTPIDFLMPNEVITHYRNYTYQISIGQLPKPQQLHQTITNQTIYQDEKGQQQQSSVRCVSERGANQSHQSKQKLYQSQLCLQFSTNGVYYSG